VRVPLRLWVNAGFGVALIVLLIVSYVSYRTAASLLADVRQVRDTQMEVHYLAEILSSIRDAEDSQRGYLLTGDPSYLQPYRTAQTTIANRIAALRALMARTPTKLRTVDTLQSLIAAKFAELQETIDLRSSRGFAPAVQAVRTNRGKQVMNNLRSLVETMEGDEEKQLMQRSDDVAASARHTITAISLGSLLAVALVALATVAVNRDITAWQRVERQRENLLRQVEIGRARFAAILESAAHGVIAIDAETGRVIANREAVRLFGHPFTRETGLAQYVSQIRHLDGSAVPLEDAPVSRALHGETTPHAELLIVRPDGRTIPVLESAAPIRGTEGNILGAVTVFQDISVLKELERLREEWTSVIAHDLRQPVAVIAGYADLLARQAEQYPPSVKTRVEHILTSARQLNRMISDLLDVSRIEARRLVLECKLVDLPALVHDVVERTAEITRGHPVRVDVKCEIPLLEIDPIRIEQVLTNLLSNAAKYSYPGTPIELTLECRDREIDTSVTNRGPGISQEELPRLFTRFYRTPEARAAHVAGLGLGLYITKGLVEAHGGRIWVQSVPGQTTTFTFTLPIPRQARA
jgi:PAS domain S-box-containing protein